MPDKIGMVWYVWGVPALSQWRAGQLPGRPDLYMGIAKYVCRRSGIERRRSMLRVCTADGPYVQTTAVVTPASA